MNIIGLLGGVASGKSFVAAELARLGAVILDADRAGHEVLHEPEVIMAARNRWGGTVFNAEGDIDRKRLAAIVFADTPAGRAELAYLEQLTHPRIGQRLLDQLQVARNEGVPLAVLDAPVMLKAGWDRMCDTILFVDASDEVRLSRALARGWTEAEFRRREAAQEPVAVKAARADLAIDNSGPPEATRAQVERVYRGLIE